jgi:ATP adenylyltransferase/5',5'''-P-1,P-4-tetraphosphate phosphorylase II
VKEESRVQNHRILSTFPSVSKESLVDLSHALLKQQLSSWPQLIEGYHGLKQVRTHEIELHSHIISVQHNPKRIVSTGAKVDPQSISERKCFLCLDNLSPDQMGILYRDKFVVLCNPFPIVDKHLTIPYLEHIPQSIEGVVPVFLDLAREMAPAFTMFYNGPKCGASAPDHLHFQACPSGVVPVERVASHNGRENRRLIGEVSLSSLKFAGQYVIVIEGKNEIQLQDVFMKLVASMRRVLRVSDEPMMNVFCLYVDSMWRIIVFVRQKHRPGAFFKEGDGRVVISPAALDLGGVIVTPIDKDFERMDASMLHDVFSEVLVGPSTVDLIVNDV